MLFPRYKSLMHTLARYGDHDGKSIFPGKALLAQKEKCTERWIQMLLRDLEQEGYIQALDKKGGRGHKTHYEICLEKLGLVTVTFVTTEVTTEQLTPPPEIPASNVTANGAHPPVTTEEEALLFSLQDWERRATSRPQSEFFKKKLLEAQERYQKFKEKQHVPTT